jgi:flagellar hook-basal body complex protein FliE
MLGSIGGIQSSLLTRAPASLAPTEAPIGPVKLPGLGIADPGAGANATQPGGFGKVFDQLVSSVDAKQQEAQALTRNVLLGDTGNLHQSMIAMQEAGVAFQLMVEVRNKVVESYQELMRMPV